MNSFLVLQGETVLFGIVKHVWRNGVCNQNRFELHGKTSSKKIELYYARTPPKFFQSFVLVDFTTLINNLVYLDVQRQRDRVSVAFESISGAHNVFRYLYPNSARLVRLYSELSLSSGYSYFRALQTTLFFLQ